MAVIISFVLGACKVPEKYSKLTKEYLTKYNQCAAEGDWDKGKEYLVKLINLKEVDSEAIVSFIKSNETDEALCCNAIEIMGDAGPGSGKKCVKALVTLMEMETNINIKTSIIYSLGKLKSRQSVEPLKKLLDNDTWSIRIMAEDALKNINNKK